MNLAAESNCIIVALDFSSAADALVLAERLDPAMCRVKVGKELFTRAGPALVERLMARGFDVFLDLKFHDIPNTVAGACRAAARLGVWMINVHALGGRTMMKAARDALGDDTDNPRLIAVTVLTSLGDEDLGEIGLQGNVAENVLRLAALTRAAGLDGVVCSPWESTEIKTRYGNDFVCVTPGIRPADSNRQDQKRFTTPIEALSMGADYLVIGRPVTAASDPARAVEDIQREISAFLAGRNR